MVKFTPAILLVLFVLVGCQQQAARSELLPPPNFNPPAMAQKAAPAPPVAAAPRVDRQAPAVVSSGIPREWVPMVRANAWRWIVIHHSATPAGGAAAFDKMHRAKGWDELGYHFVIGNGTDTGDGQIEVGSRWPKQKWGAHAKTDDNRYNNFGIGICLVGNFDVDRPTAAQMRSLSRLVAYLEKTYRIPADRVLGHGDTKPTDCPGKHCSLAEVRRLAAQALAAMEPPDALEAQTAAGTTLLHQTGE